MKDCTVRLIVILEHLASNQHRSVTTRELVQQVRHYRLDASERTIQRGINQLKIMYWIEESAQGWRLTSRLDRFYIRKLRDILHSWQESEEATTCA